MSRSEFRPSWRRAGAGDSRSREGTQGRGPAYDLRRLSAISTAAVVVAVVAVAYGAYSLAVSGARYATLDAETESVVVAASDIGVGQTLTAEQVSVREVPVTAVPDEALRDATSAIGKVALSPIPRNAVVARQSLAGEGASTLAGRIQAGKVALSVTVSQQSGVAGLVHQGDAVSVLGVMDSSREGSATVLASHAKVLALDAGLDAYDDAYTALTLEVSPEESEAIATAQSVGQVTCALEPSAQSAQ